MNLLDIAAASEPHVVREGGTPADADPWANADADHWAKRAAVCPHSRERRTLTDWGEPYGVRTTWTCEHCGRVRGRA